MWHHRTAPGKAVSIQYPYNTRVDEISVGRVTFMGTTTRADNNSNGRRRDLARLDTIPAQLVAFGWLDLESPLTLPSERDSRG